MPISVPEVFTGYGGRIVPGVSRAAPVISDDKVPDSVDVVVIGGGNIGCFTALELAERGVSVALCEKGVIAGEASGRSLGWIDSMFLDPAKMELIGRSKALWSNLERRINKTIGYAQPGVISLLSDQDAMDRAHAWLQGVNGLPGVDARLVTGEEVLKLAPGAGRKFAGGLHQPSDASVEPTLAAPAVAAAARARGATILQHCAVRGLERTGGKISAAVTEKGVIKCQAAVLAGGWWSSLMARFMGFDLPQFQAHASMATINANAEETPDLSAWAPGYAWRKQADGSFTVGAVNGAAPITPQVIRNIFRLWPAIRAMWDEVDPVLSMTTLMDYLRLPGKWSADEVSPFERNRILAPEIRHKHLARARAALEADFPVFSGATVLESWGGVLITTLDNMPVLSKAPAIDGLYLGTGFYYGLTMGPAAGEALADLVTGKKPGIDLHHYRYERFFDGSKLEFRT